MGGAKGRQVYKVGRAVSVEQRAAEMNFAFPNLQVLSWKAHIIERHATGQAAADMEAHVHELLQNFRALSAGNQEIFICDEIVLLRAWTEGLTASVARKAAATSARWPN